MIVIDSETEIERLSSLCLIGMLPPTNSTTPTRPSPLSLTIAITYHHCPLIAACQSHLYLSSIIVHTFLRSVSATFFSPRSVTCHLSLPLR